MPGLLVEMGGVSLFSNYDLLDLHFLIAGLFLLVNFDPTPKQVWVQEVHAWSGCDIFHPLHIALFEGLYQMGHLLMDICDF
jgi:hypothetical protein